MATFPATPVASFPINKTQNPKTRTVTFADGYEHRITFGLAENQNPKVFNLSWKNITLTESDTLMDFLNARATDNASFDYTPPGDSTSYKFVAEPGYSESIDYAERATVTATFRQVFEP
tara:strand:+ start:192 stop:548 length:357 start_codon:yes stop_codon:yes gene_type:complete